MPKKPRTPPTDSADFLATKTPSIFAAERQKSSPACHPRLNRPRVRRRSNSWPEPRWYRGTAPLLRLGLRRPVNGWRRGAGLVLRGDAAKFVLSAFNLDILSDQEPRVPQTPDQLQQHLRRRLAKFLQPQRQFHCLIRHETDRHHVIPHTVPGYTLAFEPWIDGPARFIRPDAWNGEHGTSAVPETSPVLEFVCRIAPDQLADVWVRVNHVAADGVPVQEMLSRLEKAWGVGKPLVVPAGEEFEPHTAPRPSPGRAGTAEVQTFIKFDRLLAWRSGKTKNFPRR